MQCSLSPYSLRLRRLEGRVVRMITGLASLYGETSIGPIRGSSQEKRSTGYIACPTAIRILMQESRIRVRRTSGIRAVGIADHLPYQRHSSVTRLAGRVQLTIPKKTAEICGLLPDSELVCN